MGDVRKVYEILVGNPKRKIDLGRTYAYMGRRRRRALKKKDVRMWTGFVWLRTGASVNTVMSLRVT
jgi:hypothetical protein